MNYIIIRTIAVLIASYITHVGVVMAFNYKTFFTALLVALVLAIINHTIKPIIHVATLPINLLTLGLFSFVINGFMVLLASYILSGLFIIPSLMLAIWFSIVMSVVNWVLHSLE